MYIAIHRRGRWFRPPEKAVTEKAGCFTAEQVRFTLAEAEGQYRVMFTIAAMTGFRAGEILALSTGDFDLEKPAHRAPLGVARQTPNAKKLE